MKNTDEWVGPRRLPTLRFGNDEYFIDNRLREFRTVTPPIRPIEFVRFDSKEGLRMLGDCEWLECARCGRMNAIARQSTESEIWCCECRRRMLIREHYQPEAANSG
jgi:DNA-directed RNA polymerase subunit RPC12/RpoP